MVIGEHTHHGAGTSQRRVSNVSVTLTIRNQEGRLFSGTFASPRGTESVIGAISRSGGIYVVDDDGHSEGTLLAPDRLEFCYSHVSRTARVVACTEFIKQ